MGGSSDEHRLRVLVHVRDRGCVRGVLADRETLMTTYIGIEQNTDLKCPRSTIKRFGASRKRAMEWGGDADQGFAFPGAARSDVSPGMQNWHHRLRSVYEMPAGYRLPQKEAERRWEARRGSVYQNQVVDHLADLISRDGDQVRDFS